MIENFLIQCKTRKMEVLQFLVAAFGGYVFGIIVMMIIRANTVEKECVTLGMLIGMIILVFMHFFGITFSFVGEFNMALSMGATRKSFVGSYALFNMVELAGLELLLFVLGKIELALISVIYPQCEIILDVTQYFQWKYLLAVIVGMTVVELFLGAVILRFGMKAFWVVWAIWMFLTLVPVKLSENEVMAAKMHQLGEQIGLENIVQYLFAAGVVAAVIMAVLGWNLLKKQRVTV
ncbi:hypothetical protein H8S51_017085 [Roseburia rectibacter]|jgi:hypothetical protein|uniref:hypothetical protein n=1 Tax=Roseburia TaxID=841 RepID=UPI00164B51EE|nr:hypothetical protein [Roseburia rectibacter]UMY99993.1 hypothetical protein H8S51_017085 [Roseburia rectibacter]